MKRYQVDIILTQPLHLTRSNLVPHGYGHQRYGLKSRFVAVLVAIASAVACGGGGAPVSRQALLAVQLSSSSVAFGNQLVNFAGAAQTVTVTNNGSLALVFTAIKVTGNNAGDFVTTTDTCFAVALSSGASCAIGVTFTPTGAGTRSATLNIADSAPDSPQMVALSGTGTVPTVSLSAPGLSLGSKPTGSASAAQTETITNTGNGNLVVSTVTVAGTNASDFAVSADACTGSTVAPGSACTVSVIFTPSGAGSRSATLNFSDNAPDSPQSVSLSGTGTGPEASFSPRHKFRQSA